MIRRTTPNKSFTSYKRETSCCKWCFTDSPQIQKQMVFIVKPTPMKARAKISNTASTTGNREESEIIFRTPRNQAPLARRLSFEMKQQHSTTLRIQHSSAREAIVSLPSSEAAANPLQRLSLRNKSGRLTIKRDNRVSNLAGAIVFNYSTARNREQRTGGYLNLDFNLRKPEQPLQIEESRLTQEVERHRAEYKRLLQEFNELKRQKETNIDIFREMLSKLKAQQAQVRELQRFRREQIKQLRGQIQELIAEQGSVVNEQ